MTAWALILRIPTVCFFIVLSCSTTIEYFAVRSCNQIRPHFRFLQVFLQKTFILRLLWLALVGTLYSSKKPNIFFLPAPPFYAPYFNRLV